MDSNSVRDEWANRSGEFSPAYYAYYGSDETSELIRETLLEHLDADASVLELGCGSGRHLAHLADHGFSDLSGVDINEASFEVMADRFPALAETGTFYRDAIESVVGDFGDGAFDAVYSVETLQHLHPDVAWVFDDVARITDDVLMTIENEGTADGPATESDVNYVDDGVPLYYRDWDQVFTARGLTAVDVVRDGRDVARTFRVRD